MIVRTLASELNVEPRFIEATIALLDEGNTVPFIARYRKEVTGGLDDTQLRTLATRLNYMRELEDRKETVLAAIEEQGKLTDELREEIRACDSKARLEDLYLPYKKRRKTKADIAREAGIGAMVEKVINDRVAPADIASDYICEGFADTDAVITGARAIVCDDIATNPDAVGTVREAFWDKAEICATVAEGKANDAAAATYKDYFDFTQPIKDLPSHRALALLRGEREEMLTLQLGVEEDYPFLQVLAETINAGDLLDEGLGASITQRTATAANWLAHCISWAWRTKVQLSAQLDSRMRMKERADAVAVDVFARNVHDLLLAAPAGQRSVLGLDPGYRNGVKVAGVDATGKVLDTCIIYPHQPQNQWAKAVQQLTALVVKHKFDLIAVGNGTASRESDKLAREVATAAAEAGAPKPTVVVVSEAGASVYSASEVAAAELPGMDVSLRGAVSIARRLQDPLAELVKVDPQSIGVGQYQHDVDQTALATALDSVVEDAVNAVGVEVNTASAPLLSRVAGVSSTVADNIVAYRDENGPFASRAALKKVPRLGPKAFEQCAGFLRIQGGKQPLDGSAVHPEAYELVHRIAETAGVGVKELIGNTRVLSTLKPAQFADDTFGLPTVTDVLAELDKPGRDPRPEFKTASFAAGIEKIGDLKPGMVMEGTVTNVAAFGAFVDIGVHQDGLVHISAMSHDFVSDPHKVVHSGEVVRVKVMEVDVDRKRISLSLRLDDEPGEGSVGKPAGGQRSGASRGAGGNARHGSGKKPGRQGGSQGGKGGPRGGQRGGNSPAGGGGALADALKRAGFG